MFLFVFGCAHVPPPEHLPTYPLIDDRQIVESISATLHSVRNVSAAGEMELTQPNGERVQLDLAMALRPPAEARIRAYKFGQAVFDLTIKPDGVWLLSERAGQMQVTAKQLARSLSLLSGELLDEPGLILRDEGDRLLIRREVAGEPTPICIIDRPTRTIRRYELLDDHDVTRFSLDQSEFTEHDGIAWPGRIVAGSDRGRFDIHLRDVEINAGLPATAFEPPHRAVRLP